MYCGTSREPTTTSLEQGFFVYFGGTNYAAPKKAVPNQINLLHVRLRSACIRGRGEMMESESTLSSIDGVIYSGLSSHEIPFYRLVMESRMADFIRLRSENPLVYAQLQ